MELRHLATFRLAATTLNFTRTALLLNYVQSNVTAQIQALEDELGVRLFDRLGKRVILTDAGQRFLRYADQILNLADEARSALSASDEPIGSLIIGAPETLCVYRLPALLRLCRLRYPQIRIQFRPRLAGDLRRQISEGLLDIAFVLDEPLQSTSLIIRPLFIEPLLVIAAPEHPLTRAADVGPRDLEGEEVLLTERGCSYRSLFERALAAVGVQPVTTLEFDSIEAIKQCVMAGMGISVLPEIAVKQEIEQGRISVLPWNIPDFQVVTQMVWHKEKWLSPALRSFIELLCQA